MPTACWSNRRAFVLALLLACGAHAAHAWATEAVTQVVERNAAARGGAQAWKDLQTMVWAGHTESSNAPERKLAFLLELKRPARMRFEIASVNGKLVRIYDGEHGWKVRPDSNGVPDVRDYSADELAFARGAQIIEGPLMDMAARGADLKLVGTDTVGGRKALVIEGTLPGGAVDRVWVDAESFLELRLDREIQMDGGRMATSTIMFRDYRPFKGIRIPIIIETGSGPGHPTDTLVIEKVAINPEIDDRIFAKPVATASHRGGVIIDARGAGAQPTPPAH